MPSIFKDKTIILGVTGSIAAYKSADICSRLRKSGSNVYPVFTPNGVNFISPLTLSSISGNRALADQFHEGEKIHHISLSQIADLMVIAPASANTIAKLSWGLGDNLLTTTAISTRCPVLIAPAMNENMYADKLLQKNIERLKESGKYFFIGPKWGRLACGDQGMGRMEDPEIIVERISFMLNYSKELSKKNVLVTAGGTREYLDKVRYISNSSTGKMGSALAEEARSRGADKVVLVTAGKDIPVFNDIDKVIVQSSEQMKEQVLKSFNEMDIIIMAAAVSDIIPEKIYNHKLRKKDDILSKISFKINENILDLLASKKSNKQLLVGFAAEWGINIEDLQKKFKGRNIDVIVANDISRPDIGMGSEYNEVTMLTKNGEKFDIGKTSKRLVARKIWDQLINILKNRKA